MLRFL